MHAAVQQMEQASQLAAEREALRALERAQEQDRRRIAVEQARRATFGRGVSSCVLYATSRGVCCNSGGGMLPLGPYSYSYASQPPALALLVLSWQRASERELRRQHLRAEELKVRTP